MADIDHAGRRAPTWQWPVLLVLPAVFLAAALILRQQAGPFWIWHAIDPSYRYLFDALNFLHRQVPVAVADPGTPLQALGAVVLWAMHGFAGADEITEAVLDAPEAHLHAILTVVLALDALAMVAVGAAARLALGGLVPALVAQSGPLLSDAVMRHIVDLRPESLLVAATLALAAVAVWTVGATPRQRQGRALAAAFGLVAALAVATRASAAPLLLLPVFLLAGWRALAVYTATAVAAFVVLTLPAVGAYGDVVAGLADGAGGGVLEPQGPMVVDPYGYPRAVLAMLARPLLWVPIVLALGVLALGAPRSGGGARPLRRALGGLVVVQAVQVLLAARSDAPLFLLPALVLSGLTLALLYVAAAELRIGSAALRRMARRAAVAAFAVALVARAGSATAVALDLQRDRVEALRIDGAAFARCARIFFPGAGDPLYALLLGDARTGGRRAEAVARRVGVAGLWLDGLTFEVRDAVGPRDLAEALIQAPCAFLRGRDRGLAEVYLADAVPGLIVRDGCSTRDETVLTAGVDCTGRLTGR